MNPVIPPGYWTHRHLPACPRPSWWEKDLFLSLRLRFALGAVQLCSCAERVVIDGGDGLIELGQRYEGRLSEASFPAMLGALEVLWERHSVLRAAQLMACTFVLSFVLNRNHQ